MSAAGRIFTPVRLVDASSVEEDLSPGEIQRSIGPAIWLGPSREGGDHTRTDTKSRTDAGLMRPGLAEAKLADPGLRDPGLR